MVRRGDAYRLAPGVFSTEVGTDPARLVRRDLFNIVGRLFPDGVITDRSAPRGGPVDGVLYLAHPRRDRVVRLPGLEVTARRGAGPVEGDTELPGGLHLASAARGLLENVAPSRARSRAVPRRLTRHELGQWVDRILRHDGEERLNRVREQARTISGDLGVDDATVGVIENLIGVALGTRDGDDLPPVLVARRYAEPYDPDRADRFDRLVRALRDAAPQVRQAPADEGHLPFFEAYFSNFIEGNEFTVDEASAIVYEGLTPAERSEDAHDVIGTHRVVSDHDEMSRVPTSALELVALLRARHAAVMAGRPEKRPGAFKMRANQAGGTVFVAPDLVIGTLGEGFARLGELDTAWERAVYMMFVVSEVHPFEDGNGRIARIMMNAELVASGQVRMFVPIVFRTDYLGALRLLSRADEPSALVKTMRYAQDWTARIDFTDFESARAQMAATNAFEPPEDGVRLVMPERL
jgi:hypothetical protein